MRAGTVLGVMFSCRTYVFVCWVSIVFCNDLVIELLKWISETLGGFLFLGFWIWRLIFGQVEIEFGRVLVQFGRVLLQSGVGVWLHGLTLFQIVVTLSYMVATLSLRCPKLLLRYVTLGLG